MNTVKVLMQTLVDLVVEGSVIEEYGVCSVTFLTSVLYQKHLEVLYQLSEVGISATISGFPSGVIAVDHKDLTKKGKLVIRLEWSFPDD